MAKCSACNATLAPGARYCTKCGAPAGGRVQPPKSRLPWLVAGGALLLVVVVLLWPMLRGDDRAADDGRVPISQLQTGNQSGTDAPGPLTGTPREQADRLFNRVMSERESGDSARAAGFLPMAIQAYQIAGELDADGLYHLSLLHAFNKDYATARTTAEQILSTSPNHLLALSAAANAARLAGDDSKARAYYQRFLASYDAEINTGKQEYQDHGRMLPELRAEAERFSK